MLDLDHTLWGGVIGDDGVEGIVLGAASPSGEAFEDWQRYLKGLSDRGVILAVCSKNAPEVAATGFTHAGSVLKREDFAAFECSWNDKVGGLRRIARDLNLGIDSFVFADDNPAECDLVRQALPEVAVVHLGSDPAQFIDIFDAGHWLDLQAYTTEDLGRTASYAARAAARRNRSRRPISAATWPAWRCADGFMFRRKPISRAWHSRSKRPTSSMSRRAGIPKPRSGIFSRVMMWSCWRSGWRTGSAIMGWSRR